MQRRELLYEPMHSGFFISCRLSKEARGLREIVSALQELAGVQGFSHLYQGCPDYGKVLLCEIRQYKSGSKFTKRLGHKNIFYLENGSSGSSTGLFRKLRESERRFEYVQRVVPMEKFFKFDETKIIREIEGLDTSKTYKITFEGRLCGEAVKSRVFNLITHRLKMRVDLTSPFYNIIVHVFKSYAGITVMEACDFNFSARNK
jgi:hypothetical protein